MEEENKEIGMNDNTFLIALMSAFGGGILGYIYGFYKGKKAVELICDNALTGMNNYLGNTVDEANEDGLYPTVQLLNENNKKLAEKYDIPESEIVKTTELAKEGIRYDRVLDKHAKPKISDLAVIREKKGLPPIVVTTMDGREDFLEQLDNIPEDDDQDDEENDTEDMKAENEEGNLEPHLITAEEFMDKSNGFEKIDLHYYRFDEVMCADDDQPVEDPEDLLGWDFHKVLEKESVAYVRNAGMDADYEVRALSKSYKEDVADRCETDAERQRRRDKRNQLKADKK